MNPVPWLTRLLADALQLPAEAGPPAVGAFLAYAGAALLCAVAAWHAQDPAADLRALRSPDGLTARARSELRVWQLSALALLLLGLNGLVHGDRLFILWIRDLAARQGWYESRRWLQFGVLAAAVPLTVLAARTSLRSLRSLQLRAPARWLLYSLAALSAFHALRLVSLHYTDLLLDARIAGVSAGRWIELLALAVAAAAAGLRLRPAPARRLKEFPHV